MKTFGIEENHLKWDFNGFIIASFLQNKFDIAEFLKEYALQPFTPIYTGLLLDAINNISNGVDESELVSSYNTVLINLIIYFLVEL